MPFINYIRGPHYQVILCLSIIILLFVIIRPAQLDRLWVIAGVLYLVFILINAISIWFADHVWSYFFYSLLISVLFLFVANGLVNLYSKLWQLEGSGESSMIFLVIIYHPVLLLAVMLVRWFFMRSS